MPSRYIHKQISKILVKKECDRTHKIIDYPVKFLKAKHRILFHDPLSAMIIGFLADGRKGVYAGLLHMATDYCCSEHRILKYAVETVVYMKKEAEKLFL